MGNMTSDSASSDGVDRPAGLGRAWVWIRALVACCLLCVPPLPPDLHVAHRIEVLPIESSPFAPAGSSEEEDHSQQTGQELAVVRQRASGRRQVAVRVGSACLSHHHGCRPTGSVQPTSPMVVRRERDAWNGFGGALRC
jgi:hypothetical protein